MDDSEFFLMCTGNTNQRGWGRSGENGADCTFTADKQGMQGNVIWDSISELDFYMINGSALKGSFVQDESYAGCGGNGYANLYIDGTSTWVVTEDARITNLYTEGNIVDEEGESVSIIGADGTVYIRGTGHRVITVDSYNDTVNTDGAAKITLS